MGTGGVFLRKIRAKVSDQPTGFVWIEKGRLAASGYPASRTQLEWLSDHGIGSVLTLTEDPLPNQWVKGLKLTVEHLPMKDHWVPDAATLDRAASYVQREVKGGNSVLVHCLAGEGRTGCVLAGYLIKERGVSADEAMKTLRRIKPAFIEWSQEKAIVDYGRAAKP